MARVMAELKAASPNNVIVVDETITANLDLFKTFTFSDAGDYYSGRGGGIGQGVAGALGVAVAEPSRPILCLSGDGSSMYSIQALWTAAHHDLPIVFVILANREYRVLKHNIDAYRARFDVKSNKPYMHMDLSGPVLGFVDLAKGMGVAGTHVTKADDIQARGGGRLQVRQAAPDRDRDRREAVATPSVRVARSRALMMRMA